jgi:hypothetical protein
MPPTPQFTLDDDYTEGLHCSICGQAALKVIHLDRLPDYVTCQQCGSALVVEEGGDRVMYGKINSDYPKTQRFALRQWVWPEAIEKRAISERPPADLEGVDVDYPQIKPEAEIAPQAAEEAIPSAAVPIPTEPEMTAHPEQEVQLIPEPEAESDVALPPSPLPGEIAEEVGDIFEEPAAAPSPEIEARLEPAKEPIPTPAPLKPPSKEGEEQPVMPQLSLRETDPPPGQRYRVVIKGRTVKFPRNFCAHCFRKPVRGRLPVDGSLPSGQGVGQRQVTTFNLPVCRECHKRASRLHEEEKSARLQAYLISALVAMVLLVAALAFGVDLQEQPLVSVLILATLAVVGYSIPVLILLGRVGYYPPPPDAAYVRSTLLVPSDIQGLETAFEWRNQAYAERFYESNKDSTLGKMTPVKDRSHPTHP